MSSASVGTGWRALRSNAVGQKSLGALRRCFIARWRFARTNRFGIDDVCACQIFEERCFVDPRVSLVAPLPAPAIVEEKISAIGSDAISCNDHCVTRSRAIGREIRNDRRKPVSLDKVIKRSRIAIHRYPNVLSFGQCRHERRFVRFNSRYRGDPCYRASVRLIDESRIHRPPAARCLHFASARSRGFTIGLTSRLIYPRAREFRIGSGVLPIFLGREWFFKISFRRTRHVWRMISRPNVYCRDEPWLPCISSKSMIHGCSK
jgi:hypothetical protein